MSTRERHRIPADLRRGLSRRDFLLLGTGVAGAALLAACGGSEPTPTTAPAPLTATAAQIGSLGNQPTPTPVAAAPSAAAAATATKPPVAPSAASGEQKKGGILKVVIIGEPPVVADAMFTTATVTSNIAAQIFEGLFTRDAKYAPKPMLVEKYTVSADAKNYEFTLRTGVKFHNDKVLTATDVVASLKRWGLLSGRGKLVFGRLEEGGLKAKDPQTVTMAFKEPTGVLLDFLALTEAFVLPAEIADAVGKEKLSETQFIGTGPFKFVERKADQYIRLVRNDGYAARDDAPDGQAGKKVAYLDELRFIPVPDASVRTNGLITGEYHFVDTVEPDQYDTVKNDPNLVPLIVKPYYWTAPHFNKKQGLFTDKRLRQAVGLVLNRQEIMVAAFGRQEFVRLEPSVSARETVWYSEVGKEQYNKLDLEAAKALLKDAGYTGQTIRWLTTKEYPYMYNSAAYAKQKMEAIGMKVELVVSDWATVVANRAKPDAYEIFLTGHSGYGHPATQPFNDKAWPGFWDNAQKDKILGDMVAEADPAKQKRIIEDYEKLIYDEVPFVKCGDYFLLRAHRKEVKGYVNPADWFFWNVSLA